MMMIRVYHLLDSYWLLRVCCALENDDFIGGQWRYFFNGWSFAKETFHVIEWNWRYQYARHDQQTAHDSSSQGWLGRLKIKWVYCRFLGYCLLLSASGGNSSFSFRRGEGGCRLELKDNRQSACLF